MTATWRTLSAEVVRTRGSAAALFPVAGLVIAAISSAGVLITPQSGERAALLWQMLYVTGMAAGLLTLLAGITTAREEKAREAGTPWRPVRPGTVVLARFAVLACLSALFHALAFWTVAPVSLLAGAPVDTAGVLLAGAVCWAATLGVLAAAFVATERWGTVPVFLAAWVWQLCGTLAAESAAWVFVPPTWAVRAMLPVLGAHLNAVPLAPGHPLADESPVLALALSVGLMVVVLFVRLVVPAPGRSGRSGDPRPVGRRSTREGALAGIGATLRGGPVVPLCLGAAALCLVTAAVYPVGYLLGLYTFALLPIGASVTAVLLWGLLAPGWRLLVPRRPGMPEAVQVWLIRCVGAMTALVIALCLIPPVLSGGPAAHTVSSEVLRAGALWLILGTACGLGALWLTVRHGPGWALGATSVVVVVSATFGGDVLAQTWMWLLGMIGGPPDDRDREHFRVGGLPDRWDHLLAVEKL
ncbi:hypothetical protein ABZ635_26180, partial [Nocardiopsis sp. NPDC007018]|uniref:hypothetical protein n=1 Tax=Nocardiopsis sp. NPDC007018 TaxID=3155721 RepID=UPI003400E9CC